MGYETCVLSKRGRGGRGTGEPSKTRQGSWRQEAKGTILHTFFLIRKVFENFKDVSCFLKLFAYFEYFCLLGGILLTFSYKKKKITHDT